MNKTKSVSSKDVAREAGVSQATVSYVLNNVKGIRIKPETKEAVLLAAKKLNYHPNLIAQSMRLKKSMSIGIVTDKNISNFMFMQVLEGIKDALIPRNYSIVLSLSKTQDIENAEHIKYFSSNRIDAIIFAFSNLPDEQIAYLVDNNIPFVIIHNNAKNEMIHLVRNDITSAFTEAVRFLSDKGIRNIGYIGTGTENMLDRRYMGYIKSIESAGISIDRDLLIKMSGNEEEMDSNLDEYISSFKVMPRALFCETTIIGFKLLKYAAARGIRVPDDLAVIGIGTSKFSPHSYPALSALEAPLYDMGYRGTEMLFDIMKGNTSDNEVVLEWSFIPRDSS